MNDAGVGMCAGAPEVYTAGEAGRGGAWQHLQEEAGEVDLGQLGRLHTERAWASVLRALAALALRYVLPRVVLDRRACWYVK